MKVMITGANGQLGQTIVEYGVKHPFFKLIPLAKAQCNISDINAINKAIVENSIDIVLNAAAYNNVEKAEDEPNKANAVNADALKNMAIICNEHRIPLIHISTDYVFNNDNPDRLLTEKDQANPINAYGQSKLLGEQYIRDNLKEHVIIRTSWLFSNKQTRNFYNTMISLMETKNELKVVNDQYGCPTSVESLAQVLYQILDCYRKNELDWGTYHYCDSPSTTWYGFAKYILDQYKSYTNKNIKLIPVASCEYPTRAKRPKASILGCRKICSMLNIQQSDWRVYIDKYMSDMNCNIDGVCE